MTVSASVEQVEPGSNLGLERGDVVVCVPVYGAVGDFGQCMHALLMHTPADVAILVADDASPDPAVGGLVAELARTSPGRRLTYSRQPKNIGFVRNANAVFAAARPADVVIVNSDCVVTSGWFESLREAAMSNTRVATASALTNSGTLLSVPDRNRPTPQLPQDWSLHEAAAAVRRQSLRLRPQIPTAVGHCVWIRRSALDLVGDFDDAFTPGYEEEVDFSQRCIQSGLCHVVADDALVLHYGGATFGYSDAAQSLRQDHHAIIQARYSYYDGWVAEVESAREGPLPRALGAATRAFRGMSVTIDGLVLTRFMTGTQLHVLEVIAALREQGGARLRVLVPHDLGDYAASLLSRMPDVVLLPVADIHEATPIDDVVHRPYQVSSAEDLTRLRQLGHRLVVTQQDVIGYHNPAYYHSYEAWRAHRRLTRTALAAADQVVFFSRHAAHEALATELLDRSRANVVYLGTNHQLAGLKPEPRPPRGAERVGDEPFLLCLGTDFLHKNRLFALRLLEALREHHGWPGSLVFAGPHVARGSSASEEATYLMTRPGLCQCVHDLAAVNEAGKVWLQQRATALVYPTTFEGFGLVPFEAGDAALPCLFAPTTSLAELLPSEAALLVPWDADESAARVAPVLQQGPPRERHIDLLRAAGARLTWRKTADSLASVYREAVKGPAREASSLGFDQLELEGEHERLEVAYWDLEKRHARFDAIDMDLVGSDGTLPRELRRPLLAISRRRWLRAIFFGPLMITYRLGYFARHRRMPPPRALMEGGS